MAKPGRTKNVPQPRRALLPTRRRKRRVVVSKQKQKKGPAKKDSKKAKAEAKSQQIAGFPAKRKPTSKK